MYSGNGTPSSRYCANSVSMLGYNWSPLIFIKAPCTVKSWFSDKFYAEVICRRDLGKGPCGTVRVMREMIFCMDHWEKQTSQSLTTFCFCYLMSFFSIPFWSPDVNPVLLCVHVHQCDTHFISVFMHCCWLQEVPSSCSDEPGDLARRIEIEVMKIASDRHYFFSLRSITKWQAMIDNLLSVAAGWLLNVNSVVLSISLHFPYNWFLLLKWKHFYTV